jgi:hypothetical protein
MSPLRGEIWDTSRRNLPRVLVLSGGMYNALPDAPSVLVVPVVGEFVDGWTVQVGEEFTVVDRIAPLRKAWLTTRRDAVDVETLTAINNALFKILATD